jgi:hypothetical protein
MNTQPISPLLDRIMILNLLTHSYMVCAVVLEIVK